jgi:peptidoglycan/LPS O-acetylase OafA/YrhL
MFKKDPLINTKKNRYAFIDNLRAVAIILVVLFHYTYHYESEYLLRSDNWSLEIAKFGWSGVDLFFIISGYCIAMTITKTHNFFEFIVRRGARLYPGYLVCGILTLTFYSVFELPGREVGWFVGFMNLIFANFIPKLNFQYIDGIYWALIVEMKFYLFFGIIFFLIKDLSKSIYFWFIFCFIGNILLLTDKITNTFLMSIFPHANLFLLGLSIYYYKKISILSKILIFTFLIITILVNNRYADFEIYFISMISIVFFILHKKIDFKIKYLPYLGILSYTWYLTHNAIGIIIIRELNRLNFQTVSIFVAIIFTLLLSYLVFNFIEIKLKSQIINVYKKLFVS